MDVAPKWFHFYHFLHRLGLLIQSSLLSSTVRLVVLVKIVFLKNIFSSDFDGNIKLFFGWNVLFLLYFNILLSDGSPSTEYVFLPQMNTQNLFKNLKLKTKPVTLFRRCAHWNRMIKNIFQYMQRKEAVQLQFLHNWLVSIYLLQNLVNYK